MLILSYMLDIRKARKARKQAPWSAIVVMFSRLWVVIFLELAELYKTRHECPVLVCRHSA